MNKKKIRCYLRLFSTIMCCWLYVPHLLIVAFSSKKCKELIFSDIETIEYQIGLRLHSTIQLLYHLHINPYYRVLFYHRIGPVKSSFISWYRPGNKYFRIRSGMTIGGGMWIAHPYSTILNANSIGKNFRCIHCTTLGEGNNGIPTIGDNVSLGASVIIVGNIHVGNNVIIGAGSVVVKDIPDNCVAVGNPCKPIKYTKQI